MGRFCVTLTEFAVTQAFLFHLTPEGPDSSQLGLLVVRVLSKLSQPILLRRLLLLLPVILQLQEL